jgi:hypothetical protein
MAEAEQTVVVGVFEDRKAVVGTFDALLKDGFQEEQLGFVARTHEDHVADAQQHVKHGYGVRAVTRGILGGILGAADILLVPFIGPTDASNIFATALPVTEEALDHLPYPGSHDKKEPLARPDDALRSGEHAPLIDDATSRDAQGDAVTSPTIAEEAEAENIIAGRVLHEEREGAVAGGVVGGALGAAAAALVLPGVGFVVAGGIIAAALGGGAIGSVAGSFLGTLTEMGIPHEDARRYEHEVNAGRTLVTVRDTSKQEEAANILRQQGALDVQIH